MSVFRSIVSRVFGRPAGTETASTGPVSPFSHRPPEEAGRLGGAPAAGANSPQAAPPFPAGAAPSVDVEAVLAGLAARNPQPLDWRHSIVDLMKLVELDSSLASRKALAQELGYPGTPDGSAEMNLWLHRAVMRRLAESGGRVPDDLRG
jgi:hypothetical protein